MITQGHIWGESTQCGNNRFPCGDQYDTAYVSHPDMHQSMGLLCLSVGKTNLVYRPINYILNTYTIWFLSLYRFSEYNETVLWFPILITSPIPFLPFRQAICCTLGGNPSWVSQQATLSASYPSQMLPIHCMPWPTGHLQCTLSSPSSSACLTICNLHPRQDLVPHQTITSSAISKQNHG